MRRDIYLLGIFSVVEKSGMLVLTSVEARGIDEHPMCRSRCYGQRQDQMRKTHKSSRHLLVVRYTFGRVNTREARVAFRSLSCEARVAKGERAAILVAGIVEADSKGCQYKQILLHVPG